MSESLAHPQEGVLQLGAESADRIADVLGAAVELGLRFERFPPLFEFGPFLLEVLGPEMDPEPDLVAGAFQVLQERVDLRHVRSSPAGVTTGGAEAPRPRRCILVVRLRFAQDQT